MRTRRLCLVLLAASLLPACSGLRPPNPIPVSGDAVLGASAHLRRVADERDDLELVEGGLLAEFYTYEWQERHAWDPLYETADPNAPANPRVLRERILVGPQQTYLAFGQVTGVRVIRWLVGAGVELDVTGRSEPLVLSVRDADEAQALADALDLLRRARDPAGPPEAPAGTSSDAPAPD